MGWGGSCLLITYDTDSLSLQIVISRGDKNNFRQGLFKNKLYLTAGMSNSKPCAGRTVIFKDRKTFSGLQF